MRNINQSNVDRLTEQADKYPSRERLLLSRNFFYGGAATSVIILLGLSAMKIEETALYIAAVADAIALPSFIVLGIIYEWYYALGKKGYGHLRLGYMRIFMSKTSRSLKPWSGGREGRSLPWRILRLSRTLTLGFSIT